MEVVYIGLVWRPPVTVRGSLEHGAQPESGVVLIADLTIEDTFQEFVRVLPITRGTVVLQSSDGKELRDLAHGELRYG